MAIHRYPDAAALALALGEIEAAGPEGGPPGETKVFRSSPSSWVGVVLEERYEIQEWIAPGRFGSDVYRALHLRTGAGVAVRLFRTGKGAARDLLLEALRSEAPPVRNLRRRLLVPLPARGLEGLKTLHLVFGAYRSAAAGQAVLVE